MGLKRTHVKFICMYVCVCVCVCVLELEEGICECIMGLPGSLKGHALILHHKNIYLPILNKIKYVLT